MTTHTPLQLRHPEVLEPVDAAFASDRAWFAAHPHELVRIRPAVEGEFMVDAAAGLAGKRQWIAAPGQPPGVFRFTAVVYASNLLGLPHEPDGSGARVRLPVTTHRPEDVPEIKAVALDWVAGQVSRLKGQQARQRRQQGKANGFSRSSPRHKEP
jgi:hypothetical protein